MEDQCIFCFNTEEVFKLHGLCDCRPNVDMTCIKKWYEMKPDTCPICLSVYLQIVPVPRQLSRDDILHRISVVCKFIFVISLAILICILILYLFALYR
jgi:hypothetical protein